MLRINSYRRILTCILVTIFMNGCDEKEEAQLSDINFTSKINGLNYLDRLPLLLPPGAQRSPIINVENSANGYIELISKLSPEDEQHGHGSFLLQIRLPLDERIATNEIYRFEPYDGQDQLSGGDRLLYLESSGPFGALSSSKFKIETTFYGNGTIVFSEFDTNTNKARGRVEVNFPYSEWNSEQDYIKLSGTFYCDIKINN